jgi:hypothetical protein
MNRANRQARNRIAQYTYGDDYDPAVNRPLAESDLDWCKVAITQFGLRSWRINVMARFAKRELKKVRRSER